MGYIGSTRRWSDGEVGACIRSIGDFAVTLSSTEPHAPPYSPDWERLLPVVPQIQVTRNCNLACGYCFQEHSGKIIELSTVEDILAGVIEHNLSVAPDNRLVQVYWHGGEPLLAGTDFFHEVLRLEGRFPELSFQNRIQTNGTLLDDAFARLFADHGFQVGFSIDGPKDIHDLHRRFRGSRIGSFDAAMRGIECYRRHTGVDRVAAIAVVTRAGIGRARDIFHFFRELGAEVQLDLYDLRWLDLLPSNTEAPSAPDLAPSPEDVGRFLIELFDLWFHDQEGRVDFRELRQEAKMILQPEMDRGDPFHKRRCDFRRLVFSPDGGAFVCDQWMYDESVVLGNIRKDSLAAILENKALLWDRVKRLVRRSGEEMACGACEWGRRCGGGCLTCMKYNAFLLRKRSDGGPGSEEASAALPLEWAQRRGETYYCDGLRAFRRHVRQAIRRELARSR